MAARGLTFRARPIDVSAPLNIIRDIDACNLDDQATTRLVVDAHKSLDSHNEAVSPRPRVLPAPHTFVTATHPFGFILAKSSDNACGKNPLA